MARLLRWADRLSEWSGRLFAWITLASVFILTYEVVARYFFRAPTRWAHDTSTLLFGVLYVTTGAYALYTRNHVGVDVIYARLRPRARAIMDVATFVFFLLFVGAFFWYGWGFFLDSFGRREFSLNNQDIPIYPAKFAIPLGTALMLVQGFAKFIRDLHLAVTGRELVEESARAFPPAPAPVEAESAKPPERAGAPVPAAYQVLKGEDA